MKKFVVYLMVIVLAVSLGFAVFYLVKDDEVISISTASIYTDVNKDFTIDVNHENKKSYTKINISSSDDNIVKYNEAQNSFSAISGGVARINFRTNNVKFRNLWCDVIVGDGTEASPYYISSVEQLSAIGMGEEVDGVFKGAEPYTDYASNKCYKLVADIDVKNINEGHWIPLRSFSGVFDGNGYTISNINIDYDEYYNLFKDANNFNSTLHSTTNVGLFQTIENTGKVFNIKFANYRASGRYVNFGTVAGINNGTIERIEVKDAYLSVETTGAFGGLVGINESSDNKAIGTDYKRYIARIDRCSVNLTLGKKRTYEDDKFVEHIIGNTGIIGGLVGINNGGTIVYSYTTGEVNFASDAVTKIVYGGLVGHNTYCDDLTGKGGEYPTVYQGANIKDCYSNIKTHLEAPLTNADSRIAGAVAINNDLVSDYYNKDNTKEIVHNYIIGVYYNKDNLNIEDKGITKNYIGIAEFTYGTKTIAYVEDVNLPIVVGLSAEDMKKADKFISHYTSDIDFDENGVSQGVKSIAVKWLFETVWAMNEKENDGMPYLNYQLIYVPNDFSTVGTPVIIANKYQYINTEVEYPITIVSGNDRKINIEVGEVYTLKVNPVGLTLNWNSNNTNVVSVDSNGTIKGLREGSASISVSTKTGMFSDYIDVYVSKVSYSISNVPSERSLNVGETFSLSGVVVTPSTTLSYVSDDSSIASVDANGLITGISQGTTRIAVIAGDAKKYVTIKVYGQASTIKSVNLTLAKSNYTYEFAGTVLADKVTVFSAICEGVDVTNSLSYTYTSSNPKVASIDNLGNVVISGSGTAIITVTVANSNYVGYAYAYFDITQKQSGGTTTPGIIVSGPAGILKDSYVINVGDTIVIEVFGNITSIHWESGDSSVAAVSYNGRVKGRSAGTALIVAEILKTDGTYTYDTCDVTVIDNTPTPVITLTPASSSVYTGTTVTLTATFNLSDKLKWEFVQSPSGIAEINEVSNTVATVKMNAAGSVTVKVSYDNYNYVKTAVINATQKTTYVKDIRTIEQLKNVNNFLDREFVLVADLDLTGVDFTPIGTESKPFTGKFTAKMKNSYEGFFISGLKTNSTLGGLFGYTKNATLENIYVKNSTFNASTFAGAIVGVANNTKIINCCSEGNTITGVTAGGIVGKMLSGSTVSDAVVEDTNITSKASSSASVGGIVGYMSANTSVTGSSVVNTNKYISISSSAHGNAGGIAGYSQGTIKNCTVSAKIVANKNDSDYAGGVVGYTTGTIEKVVIKNTSIEGYHAGGIGGAINIAKTISLSFKETNNGYRKVDLSSSSSYTPDAQQIAVKDSVSIRGEEVGGLFGIITSGVVKNCYTRAKLDGYTRSSYVSGFASLIMSSGFNKEGGKGQVGIVENCYSACSFSGSCWDYAISKSQIHDDIKNRTAGYVFNFVFDSTLAKNTDYIDASGFLKKDPVQARKSTEEMKKKDTYTDKGFSSTYWNFSSGYPTLVFE